MAKEKKDVSACDRHITDPAFADTRPQEGREETKVRARTWNAALAGQETSDETCPICGCDCWTLWNLEDQERMLRRLRSNRADYACPMCGCPAFDEDLAEHWDGFTKVVAEHVARRQRAGAQQAALEAFDRALSASKDAEEA